MPNVSNAIGQTLFAISDVEIKRQASDSAPSVYIAKSGESIGTVKDYLEPNSSRSRGYFSFKDKNGKPYYTVHDNSLYDKKFDDTTYAPGYEGEGGADSKTSKRATEKNKYLIFLGVSILLSLLFWYLRKKFKFKI